MPLDRTISKKQQKTSHNVPQISNVFPDVPESGVSKSIKMNRTTTYDDTTVSPSYYEEEQTAK
jgi:hypothetical protein